jgi:hypothetical protein
MHDKPLKTKEIRGGAPEGGKR